jgi:hypothetical protein
MRPPLVCARARPAAAGFPQLAAVDLTVVRSSPPTDARTHDQLDPSTSHPPSSTRVSPAPRSSRSTSTASGALGAEHLVHAGEEDPVAAIQRLGGAQATISTAATALAFEQAFRPLRRGGTLVCVGLPADNEMRIPIFETVLGGLTIKGSIVGTHTDLERVFQLHRRGLTRVFRSEASLDDVNEAIEQVGRAGRARRTSTAALRRGSDRVGERVNAARVRVAAGNAALTLIYAVNAARRRRAGGRAALTRVNAGRSRNRAVRPALTAIRRQRR